MRVCHIRFVDMYGYADNLCSRFIQADYHEYGCDFNGPVTIDDECTSVVVDELPQILTEEERQLLRQLLNSHDVMSQDTLIHDFAIAKLFIQHTRST